MKEFAVAFDLDGTLIDSERAKEIAHKMTVAQFGGRYKRGLYAKCIGQSADEVAKFMIEQTGLKTTPKQYEIAFNKNYKPNLRKIVKLKPGVRYLLNRLEKEGVRMAVVTSSNKKNLMTALTNTNSKHYFSTYISGNDIEHPKPAPDAYNLAKKKLGKMDNFIVFEDTDSGIRSAYDAGASVIGIKHALNSAQDFNNAMKTFKSFSEIKFDQLKAVSKNARRPNK